MFSFFNYIAFSFSFSFLFFHSFIYLLLLFVFVVVVVVLGGLCMLSFLCDLCSSVQKNVLVI